METIIAIYGAGILIGAAFIFFYKYGYKHGYHLGQKEAEKSITDYVKGIDTPIAENISKSYNKHQ